MAAYDDSLLRGNSLERKSNCKAFNFNAERAAVTNERFDTAPTFIQNGDTVVVGKVPVNALLESLDLVFSEVFADGVTPTIDIAVGAVTIASGVSVEGLGVVSPTLTKIATGALDEEEVKVTYAGTTESLVGSVDIILKYSRFGTTNGSF